MDAASMLQELETWPAEERARFLEMAWDRFGEPADGLELTDAQLAELERRKAALDADPDGVLTWDQVLERVRAPR
jgi:putative addiction module component (TIGR02574 family)